MDMIGKRYDRLTIVKEAGRTKRGLRRWKCRCDCGNHVVVATGTLNSGHTRSCGCLRKDHPNGLRHGASTKSERKISNPKWRTYVSWLHMRGRCDDPLHKNYPDYGGRGIAYDPRWQSFEAFFADMGERPMSYTLERNDNDGNYCKGNCRWATRREQSRNRRNVLVIFFHGKRQTIAEWAEELGLTTTTIHMRLFRKWPVWRVLTPGRHHKSGKFTPNDKAT